MRFAQTSGLAAEMKLAACLRHQTHFNQTPLVCQTVFPQLVSVTLEVPKRAVGSIMIVGFGFEG